MSYLGYLVFSVLYLPEAGGKSDSSEGESESEDDSFKNTTNKIGQETSVTDLLELAKRQEFKVRQGGI